MIEPGRATGDLAEAHDAVKGPDVRIENPSLAMPRTLRATETANDYDLAVLHNSTTFAAPGSPRSRRAMSLSLETRLRMCACSRTPPGVSDRSMWPHWSHAGTADALPMGDCKREASVEIIPGAAPPLRIPRVESVLGRAGAERRKPCW